jgi:hypothetical protein
MPATIHEAPIFAGPGRRFGRNGIEPRVAEIAEALPAIALEAAFEETAHVRGRFRGQPLPIDLALQDSAQNVADRFTFEQGLAGQHFEEDHTEGPDIGGIHHVAAGCSGDI